MPCEACACVQEVMKESSDALVSLCQSLGLPCSMQGFLEAVEETQQLGRLSACDISQWASEQHRDMSRVGKHVLEVRGCVHPSENMRKLYFLFGCSHFCHFILIISSFDFHDCSFSSEGERNC